MVNGFSVGTQLRDEVEIARLKRVLDDLRNELNAHVCDEDLICDYCDGACGCEVCDNLLDEIGSIRDVLK